MFDGVFGKSFSSGKCKTLLRLAIARIKLLRNKRDIQVKQMRRELAQLLQTNQEPSARIRVEHIFREQNIMAAYEIIELFCELVVVRLPIIDSQRQCPIDLREAVASLIFAAPRCSDIPELLQVRNLFTAKYGKEFVVGAAELRPDCGVNRVVIEKLSIKPPSGDVKLQMMKDIAAENNIDWDASASESELLKAPEDLLEGPTHFLGASQMMLQTPSNESNRSEPVSLQSHRRDHEESMGAAVEASSDEKQFIPFVLPVVGEQVRKPGQLSASQKLQSQMQSDTPNELPRVSSATSLNKPKSFREEHGEASGREETFKDVISAARAAAESAERAAAAARAAASLASRKFDGTTGEYISSESDDDDGDGYIGLEETQTGLSPQDASNNHLHDERPLFDTPEVAEGSQSFNKSPFMKEASWKEYTEEENPMARQAVPRPMTGTEDFDGERHFSHRKGDGSDRGTKSQSSPFFDTDQTDFEEGAAQPPFPKPTSRPSFVHAKLPDFDDLTARFEALRSKRSSGY